MKLALFSLLALAFSDLASSVPHSSKHLVRRKKYGLPDPVRRYAFGEPVQRPNPNSVSGGYTPHAMTYSPFNDDFSCKTSSQVLGDIKRMATKGIQSVRIYATECNTLYTVAPALKKCGMKLIQGFYMTSEGVDSIDSQVYDFVNWLGEDSANAALVEMLIVGNEAVLNNWVSASALLQKITNVKWYVQQYGGYWGPVTTAEPPSVFIQNPFLCTSSTLDLVGINAHSYFDPYSTPSSAGSFVLNQIAITKNACGGKSVFVTEAGFPHRGIRNGGNTPSYENQGIALRSLFQATQGYVTFFTYRDGLEVVGGADSRFLEGSWAIWGGTIVGNH